MYVINNLVEFRPNEKSLTNRSTGLVVPLLLPATLCLLCLISHQGEVVPQNTLIKEGWGVRDGITIPNTFYQTVLTLRNALEEVGLSRDIIRTIARRGLTLIDTTIIEYVKPSVPQNSVDTGVEDNKANTSLTLTLNKKILALLKTVTFVFFIIAAINCILLYQRRATMPFQNFVLLSAPENANKKCKIYYEPTEPSIDSYVDFAKKHPEFCIKKDYVYLSGYSNTGRIVSFVCNNDARRDVSAFCSTNYYWSRHQ
ncbi:winged helix-turn-helix domain-containing protein [Trabulsiella odontotermitis]|uniref:winged helix-turn-helix domain-containing protein n=1 Tax=Trabulsiella odontotermitis TaxID=379893 RepID=UPI00092CE6AD|nr:winged helix-turn-helix domain-containing protein [Trabulsiella odontotermitis]